MDSADTQVNEKTQQVMIHPTAIVDPRAELGAGVTVGPHTVIEGDVQIGAGTQVASNALIAAGTRIGAECTVAHGAVVGTVAQDLKYKGEYTTLEIGDRTIIREYATLNRGTADRLKTKVGDDCFLMAYSHVAHDCLLGNHVIIANSVNMAGHVTLEDWVVIGGVVPIHQFVRIGCHAMVGGGFRIAQDVAPYALMGGYPLRVMGLNIVGLKRRGFTIEQLGPLRKAFRILFKSELNTTQALTRIEAELEPTAEVARLIEFMRTSERGVSK